MTQPNEGKAHKPNEQANFRLPELARRVYSRSGGRRTKNKGIFSKSNCDSPPRVGMGRFPPELFRAMSHDLEHWNLDLLDSIMSAFLPQVASWPRKRISTAL
jgi:hypothetical protein